MWVWLEWVREWVREQEIDGVRGKEFHGCVVAESARESEFACDDKREKKVPIE